MGGRIQFGILNKANTQIPSVEGTEKMSAEKNNKRKGKRTAAVIICCVAVIAVAVVLMSLGMFKRSYIVGKKPAEKDITDFYWTYSNINFNPEFQRYRFYVEDGKHMFYHEKRESDAEYGWLEEKDITDHGSMELTDEQWARFMEFITGGTIESRDAQEPTSGGSGPWTFIYWNGDRGDYQVFDFETTDKAIRFERFCIELKEEQMSQ